jgi:molecular chaperone DnaK
VSAKDKGTGKEQNIEIKSDSGLSKDEIEKMQKEAEEHAEEDKKKRQLVEARNRADQLIYSTEKTLDEHGDKLSSEDSENIKQAIKDLKETLDGDDKDAIESKIEALQNASYKLGEAIYESTKAGEGAGTASAEAQPGTGGAETAGEGEDDEDVVDADYEVKE